MLRQKKLQFDTDPDQLNMSTETQPSVNTEHLPDSKTLLLVFLDYKYLNAHF